MGCFLLCVLWCDFLKKQMFPLFCSNHKTLSRLELNFKRRLVVVDVRFENWGISLGWYSRISPSSIRGIFGHVISLDQSRASYDIIINIYIFFLKFFSIYAVPLHRLVQHRTFRRILGLRNQSVLLLNQQRSTATQLQYQRRFQRQWTAEETIPSCHQDLVRSRRYL